MTRHPAIPSRPDGRSRDCRSASRSWAWRNDAKVLRAAAEFVQAEPCATWTDLERYLGSEATVGSKRTPCLAVSRANLDDHGTAGAERSSSR